MDRITNNKKLPYREKLDKDTKGRYLAKLALINNTDPDDLQARCWNGDSASQPPTSYLDITNYLVYGISAYTCEQFRNYKSLEAHGHFTNGWVQDLFTFSPKDCDNVVVTTKVSKVAPWQRLVSIKVFTKVYTHTHTHILFLHIYSHNNGDNNYVVILYGIPPLSHTSCDRCPQSASILSTGLALTTP